VEVRTGLSPDNFGRVDTLKVSSTIDPCSHGHHRVQRFATAAQWLACVDGCLRGQDEIWGALAQGLTPEFGQVASQGQPGRALEINEELSLS
jgi:hypothetical protein